ncbi:MAG: phosphotransferase family protein [Betaproteobacteria bacterium]|nr:phosphotransferase family protein [Betaproteobacteria bacterium]
MSAPSEPGLAGLLLAALRERFASASAVQSLHRLSGGASQETWAFDLAMPGGGQPLILRRAPQGAGGRTTDTAGLAAEAALVERAAAAGVPVPAVRLVLEPRHGLGEGFVMTRIPGETLGARIVREPALAALHRVPAAGLPPLRLGTPAAELAHFERIRRGHGTARPVFELALRWLAQTAPGDPSAPCVVHGDFRNGNLVVDCHGLAAVLDWELAHLGDPMEDLGWLCVNSWRFGRGELPVGGFGTREDLFEGYTAAGGCVEPARAHWWEVMGTLKWGIMCETMAHAYLAGTETNLEFAAIGRRASETEIDLLRLLVPRARP